MTMVVSRAGGGGAPEVLVLGSHKEASWEAAERFCAAAQGAAAARGRFTAALAGGDTPRLLYRLLGEEPFRMRVPWSAVHFFFGDERFVPPQDPRSNYRLVREELLARVPLPESRVLRMQGELPDPDAAADSYEGQLRRSFGLEPGEVPRLDFILLGLGEDGHTASLFPGSPLLDERQRLVAAEHTEHAGTRRITLTLPVLCAAAEVLFLVTGASKAQAVARTLGEGSEGQPPPAHLVRPTGGRLVFLLDRPAAERLSAARP